MNPHYLLLFDMRADARVRRGIFVSMDTVEFYGNRHLQPIARGSRSDLASTLEEVKTIISVVQQAQEKQGAELVRMAKEMVVLKDDVDRMKPHTPKSGTANAHSTPPSSRRIPPELSVSFLIYIQFHYHTLLFIRPHVRVQILFSLIGRGQRALHQPARRQQICGERRVGTRGIYIYIY